jgi:RNA polymerase sigma-70 factor (ECF subfamily)
MPADHPEPAFLNAFLRERGRLEEQLYRRTRCRAAAADLVQDLFLRLWRRCSGTEAMTPAYFTRSARNIAVDHRRAVASKRELPLEAAGEAPSAAPAQDARVASRQELDRIRAALRSLPDRTRHAFLLHRAHGRSYAEIARALGVSLSTVEKDMMRALAACRAAVDEGSPPAIR